MSSLTKIIIVVLNFGTMRDSEARNLLSVPADADTAQLKTAYREAVKMSHPDRGGSAEEFQRVQRAYELLMQSVGKPTSIPIETVDGTPLSKLGNKKINHPNCNKCDGVGYSTSVVTTKGDWVGCRVCGGMGFTYGDIRNTVEREFGWRSPKLCHSCGGVGRFPGTGAETKTIHHKCEECGGNGEYKSFNTVIRPGAILMSNRAR